MFKATKHVRLSQGVSRSTSWMLGTIAGQAHLSLAAIVCDSGLHTPLLGLADPHIYPCVFADECSPTTYNSANIPGHSNTQISIEMAEKPSRTSIPRAESPLPLREEAGIRHVLERWALRSRCIALRCNTCLIPYNTVSLDKATIRGGHNVGHEWMLPPSTDCT